MVGDLCERMYHSWSPGRMEQNGRRRGHRSAEDTRQKYVSGLRDRINNAFRNSKWTIRSSEPPEGPTTTKRRTKPTAAADLAGRAREDNALDF